jgi:hypothetical protein
VPKDIVTSIRHSDFGDRDCPGTLAGRTLVKVVELFCKDCGEVILHAHAENVNKVLADMERAAFRAAAAP